MKTGISTFAAIEYAVLLRSTGVIRSLARTLGSDAARAPRSRSESISRTRNDMPLWARAMTLRRSPPFDAYRIGRGPRQMYRSHGSIGISVSTRAGTGSYPGGAGVRNG